VEELKKAVSEGTDATLIKKKIEETNNTLQKASTELYQKAAEAQQKETSETKDPESKDENVKDAEYTVDEDNKK